MGSSYLKDLALNWLEGDTEIKVSNKHTDTDLELAIFLLKWKMCVPLYTLFSVAIRRSFQVHAVNQEK